MNHKKLILVVLGLLSLCAHAQITALYQVSHNDVPIATEIWIHKPERNAQGISLSHEVTKTRTANNEHDTPPGQTREIETRWEKVILKQGDTSLLRLYFIRHPKLLEPNEKTVGHVRVEELTTSKVIDRWPFILSVTIAESRFWRPSTSMLKAQFEIFIPGIRKMVITETYNQDEPYFPYTRTEEIYNIMTDALVSKTSYLRTTR